MILHSIGGGRARWTIHIQKTMYRTNKKIGSEKAFSGSEMGNAMVRGQSCRQPNRKKRKVRGSYGEGQSQVQE